MSKPVLLPLDGSALSERALPYATRLAAGMAGPLVLLRVLTPRPPRGEDLVHEDAARAQLNAVAEQLQSEAVTVETVVSSTVGGGVARVIVETAQRLGCELIVMSTHGRSGLGRWLYGSVAEQVLRTAPIPVLLVSPTTDRAWPTEAPLRVLVPLDGSTAAAESVEPLLSGLRELSPDVLLLHVVVPPRGGAAAYMLEDLPAEIEQARASLERSADRLRGKGWAVQVRVVTGHVAASIDQVATQEAVDVIAMATHGHSGVARLVLGSVATETLQRATVPLLLFRPTNLRQPVQESAIASQQVPRQVTLLVALDLTEKADAALGPTARLARASGARVVLVNVIRPLIDLGHVAAERGAALTYVQNERRMYLDEKARQLTGLDVQTRVEVVDHGEDVDQRIAAVAAETDADVLVVVSKRIHSTGGAILGSFAQGIIARSPCPVLVIAPSMASPSRA